MCYDKYRRPGLPTTSAWMESAVKEINYRVKGADMFWNNPDGGEAILQIRDDDRLARFLARRPGPHHPPRSRKASRLTIAIPDMHPTARRSKKTSKWPEEKPLGV